VLGEKKGVLSKQQMEIQAKGVELTKEYEDARSGPVLTKEQSDKIDKVNQARSELDKQVSEQAQKRSATVSGLNNKPGAKLPPNIKRAQDEAYAETMGRLSRKTIGANGAVLSGGNTLETEAMGSARGDRNKAFDLMLNGGIEGRVGVPSLQNFRDIYENLSDQTTAEQEYAEKFRALTGRTVEQAFPKKKTGVTGLKPQQAEQDSIDRGVATSSFVSTPVAGAVGEAPTVLSTAMRELENRKKVEMDSLIEKYTKYGEDGKMTFNPRTGFESQDQQDAFNKELADLRKKQRGYTLENTPAAMAPTAKDMQDQTNRVKNLPKEQEQKKPEANKQQDTNQLISNILQVVQKIATDFEQKAAGAQPGQATSGTGGGNVPVSVSTPVNLSINSTAGENKTEVTNVADKIKTDLTAFLSSPEFIERVTTIAKTAAGNPPPPKSRV
jgi:hypothetical protein